MCDMPMEKVEVICTKCRWMGKRHPYRFDALPCPHCGGDVMGFEEWLRQHRMNPLTAPSQARRRET